MQFIGIALLVLALAACFFGGMWLFGSAFAWLFAWFGVVKPWYVFAVGWFMLTWVIGLLRGNVVVKVVK